MNTWIPGGHNLIGVIFTSNPDCEKDKTTTQTLEDYFGQCPTFTPVPIVKVTQVCTPQTENYGTLENVDS